jgi:hypothetical protein
MAGTFIMVGGNSFYSWAMVGAYFTCGVIFMIAGLICGRDADMKDLSKTETAKAAAKMGAKGAIKGAQYAAEN